MDIQELRGQIDVIDDQLVDLFVQRMAVSAAIADYKKERNLPIYVPTREREKLMDVTGKAGPEMEFYIQSLYEKIFELSRHFQNEVTR